MSHTAHKEIIVVRVLNRKSENNNDLGCTWSRSVDLGEQKKIGMHLGC
jgi:hypothetical protein